MKVNTSNIKQKALQLGYLACGIIPSGAIKEYTRSLDERVKSFPDSKELYEQLYNNANLPETAKSIIVCTRRYNKYKVPESLIGLIGKVYMFDGRLPFSDEYRVKVEFESYLKILGLHLLQRGVPDRLAAAKAGLGKFGRNNFIYSPEHGSYIWIDAWVTDEELDYDTVEDDIRLSACNEKCGKCIQACPTKALSGAFSMDRGKCVTQLQCFSKENEPDEKIRSQMGTWLYGCDACQDACPLNKNKFSETKEFPLLAEIEEHLSPERILEMDEDTYQNVVNPRFWYIGKEGMWRWKCNVLGSMINSGDSKYHPLIKKSCNHEDTRVRKLAQFGCDKLGIK
jgi:epoxyqueuosine reductase